MLARFMFSSQRKDCLQTIFKKHGQSPVKDYDVLSGLMSRRKTGNSNYKELMRSGHALHRIRVFHLYFHVHAIQSFVNAEILPF